MMTENNPLGGTLELYDIRREQDLVERLGQNCIDCDNPILADNVRFSKDTLQIMCIKGHYKQIKVKK